MAWTKYNAFIQDVGRKVHNLNADTLKVALSNTAPNAATHAVLADITEIAAGNGYTAGGFAIANASYGQSSGVGKLVGDDVLVTASGDWPTMRYVHLYNSSVSGGALIAYLDRGSSDILHAGDKFNVDLDQVAGILTLTA